MVVHYILFSGVAVGAGAAVALVLRDLFFGGRERDVEDQAQNRALSTKTRAIGMMRILCCPLTAAAASWALAVDADNILARVPSLLSFLATTAQSAFPLHPTDYLSMAVERAMSISTRVMEEVSSNAMDLIQDEAGIFRILSVFNAPNIVWCIAVLGLSVTVVSFTVVVTKPLWGVLEALFKRFETWLQPVYEPLLYLLSLFVLLEATRYSKSNDPYTFVATVAAVAGIGVFGRGLTTSRSSGGDSFQICMQITSLALYCIPIAKIHQSSLIGYIAVGALAAAIKFSAFSSGLCRAIGFSSSQELVTACIGCGSMTVLFAVAKGLGAQSDWIKPLESAASVIGSSVYLLGLDLLCYVDGSTRNHVFNAANLAAFIVAGEMFGLRGMSNLGKMCTGLFLFTLYFEVAPRANSSIVIERLIAWLFGFFAALYGGSLYLNQHPEYVAALFTGGLLD